MHDSLALLTNYAIAAWRRRWYGLCLAWVICVAGWLAVERLPDRYQSSAQVNIDTTSMLRPLMAGIAADLSAGAMAQLNLVRQTLLTRPNLERIMRMTDLDLMAKSEVDKEEIMASLRSRLSVAKGSGDDGLFQISFVDKNPQVAHDVVQALLTLFVETNLGANREELATAQDFLENQLASLKRQLEAVEQEITQFELQNRGFLPGPGNYEEQLRQLRAQRSQMQAERSQADEMRNQLSGQLAQVAKGEAEEENKAAEHVVRITELKRQIEELLTRYTESHPDVILTKRLLEREEAALKELGGANAVTGSTTGLGRLTSDQLRLQIAQQNALVVSLDQRIGQVDAEIAKLEALVAQIPEVATRHAQLQREYSVIQGNYQALTQRREAAVWAEEVDTKTQPVKFRVVEPPNVPAVPSGPDRPLLQTGVLAGGFAAGAGFCVLLGLISGTINNSARLAELSQRPVIGTVTRLTLPGQRRNMLIEQMAFVVVVAALFAGYFVALYGPAGQIAAMVAARIPVI